jgi:hypothetical protein
MTTALLPPFSTRNRREKDWIEEDFPASARTGLLHLLNDAVDKNYLSGWLAVAKELRRIARAAPRQYSPHRTADIEAAQHDAGVYLDEVDWARVYDFCERLHSYLAQDNAAYDENGETVIITKAQSQLFFSEEIQRLFEEESLGYEFRDGFVQRRGKRHTINQINKAEGALADPKLAAARKHFSKALRHFRDRESPDHENAVKEAVCAVEAAAKDLFPDSRAKTLGEFVNWATGSERPLLPKTIGLTFHGLYAFRSSGEGVSHGAASGGAVTPELSEYVLGTAASQIVLLADLVRGDEDPPF